MTFAKRFQPMPEMTSTAIPLFNESQLDGNFERLKLHMISSIRINAIWIKSRGTHLEIRNICYEKLEHL
jgi:hypothetical protein